MAHSKLQGLQLFRLINSGNGQIQIAEVTEIARLGNSKESDIDFLQELQFAKFAAIKRANKVANRPRPLGLFSARNRDFSCCYRKP